jgi:hypothetical protein
MLRTAFAWIALYAGCMTGQTTTSAQKQQPTFAMSISLKESTAKAGSEVILAIDLTNTSGKEVRFMLPASGPFLYTFKVFGPNGRPAPLTSIGHAFASGGGEYKGKNGETRIIAGGSLFSKVVAPGVVAPGGTLHDDVVLSDYVDLSQPNEYTIRLERTDPYTKLVVNSNTTTLTVTKPE